ncbi:MAG: ABC transporter ATP-binding protein [Veillonellaceae bacterium]|nr:ABC transporter ATP-binding protein [Veillonellaceae bacterium]
MENEYILEMKNIVKCFPGLMASRNVNFAVRPGEVHALLGENGAGKTTLMNILYGLYQQDAGEIFITGVKRNIRSPRDAIAAGIGMVHQHFMLVPTLTVMENVILGLDNGLKPLNRRQATEKVLQLSSKFNFKIDPNALVRDLSVGAQQRVELIKALYRGAELLILDEPTAVLTPLEVQELFVILRQFVAMGKSVIFISHKLWEVMEISNRVTVLRTGERVNVVDTNRTTKEELAAMMVGRNVVMDYDKTSIPCQDFRIELKNINAVGDVPVSSLKNVSLGVRRGEIVGVAGVDGNGQKELAEAVMGLRSIQEGKVLFDGKEINTISTRERMTMGMAHIPEDRLKQGLVLDFTVAENMALDVYDHPPLTVKGVFYPGVMAELSKQLVREFDVRPPRHDVPVRNFSGGNQQKVVLAREISREPQFILAVQPTRGLDIGATEFVHRRLLAEKEKGVGILLVSADLDEVLLVSDRVVVIYEGKIMGEFIPGKASMTEIGLMMGGTKRVNKAGECTCS